MIDTLQRGEDQLTSSFPFLIIQDYPDVDDSAPVSTTNDDDNDAGNELGKKDLFY